MLLRLGFLFAVVVGVVKAYDCLGTDGELDVYPGCGEEACSDYEYCEQTGGTCIGTSEYPFFRCQCAEDYENLTPIVCVHSDDEDPDLCDPDPCYGDGAACQVLNNTFTPSCVCSDSTEVGYNEHCPGYDEEDGEEVGQKSLTSASASCDPDPCGIGALCMVNEDDTAVCMCYNSATQQYEKTDYSKKCTDPEAISCDNNPCGASAKCYDKNPGYECVCKNGDRKESRKACLDSYPQTPCEQDENICDENATCETAYNDIICTCSPPYQGNGFICTKPGTSSNSSGKTKTKPASTAAGTAGGTSSSGDPCSSQPCGAGARCMPHGSSLYECFCGEMKVPNTESCA